MFDDYSFVLEFIELDEDLIDEKIDKMIRHDYDKGNLTRLKDDGKSLQTWLVDEDERKRCYNYIASHFPIYF